MESRRESEKTQKRKQVQRDLIRSLNLSDSEVEKVMGVTSRSLRYWKDGRTMSGSTAKFLRLLRSLKAMFDLSDLAHKGELEFNSAYRLEQDRERQSELDEAWDQGHAAALRDAGGEPVEEQVAETASSATATCSGCGELYGCPTCAEVPA
jgi:transcriptional regulator with XRE-family HTH domain